MTLGRITSSIASTSPVELAHVAFAGHGETSSNFHSPMAYVQFWPRIILKDFIIRVPRGDLCKDMEVAGPHGQYMVGFHAASTTPIINNPFTGETFELPKTTKSLSDGRADPILLPLSLAIISCPPTSINGGCVVAAVTISES